MIISVNRIPGGNGGVNTQNLGGSAGTGGLGQKPSFQEVLNEKSSQRIPEDPFKAMEQLSAQLVAGKEIGSRDLLLYQIRAGQFGARVELVSRVAESMSASLRKLQNQG